MTKKDYQKLIKIMDKTNENFIQVYSIWASGRSIDDLNQQYPINTNINTHHWGNCLKTAVNDFYKCKETEEDPDIEEVYQDYVVILFSVEIDKEEIKKQYDVDFDAEDFNLDSQIVQEAISYFRTMILIL